MPPVGPGAGRSRTAVSERAPHARTSATRFVPIDVQVREITDGTVAAQEAFAMRRPGLTFLHATVISALFIACGDDDEMTGAQRVDRATDRVEKKIDDAAVRGEQGLDHEKDELRRDLEQGKQKMQPKVDAAGDKLDAAGDRAEQKLDELGNKTADGLDRAGDKIDAAAHEAGAKLRDDEPAK